MEYLGRILIADDEETFRHSTADLLRREGFRCDCAPDAVVATDVLRSVDYDLLIADIKMNGNSDLELIQNLPEIAEGMPVILVTGYPSIKSAIQSIQLPVVAYFVKPVEFNGLLAQVQTSIKNYQVFKGVHHIRKRMLHWDEDLKRIEGALNTMPQHEGPTPIDAFLTLTFKNIAGALSDLKHLSDALSVGSSGQEVCHLLNCPQLTVLKETLGEAVEVIEKTKSAFKSKELGELRRRLEGLVKVIG